MSSNETTTISRFRHAGQKLSYLPRALGLAWTAARGWAIAQLCLIVIQGLLPATLVYLTKLFVDNLTLAIREGATGSNVRAVAWTAVFIGVLTLLSQVLSGIEQMIRSALAESLQNHIFSLIHQKSVSVDLAFYEQPEYFDHLHRARDEATHRPAELIGHVASLLRNSITLVAMGAVLARYGYWLPVVLLLSTLPAFYVVLRFTLKSHEWQRRKTTEQRRSWYYDWLLTSAETAGELRLFRLGDYFQRRFTEVRQRLRSERLRLALRMHSAELIASLLALGITAGALLWMVWRVMHDRGTLGDLVLFYQAFNQGQGLMRSLLDNVGQLYASSLFLGDLFEYLELETKIISPPQPADAPTVLRSGVTFEAVTFRYQNSARFTLENFSLTIPANRITAIVGSNGAGKSTLLKLLCRFYDPEAGHIRFDGVDVREYRVEELRRIITVLFQTHVHYSTTARENIVFGDIAEAPTQDAVESAAIASGASVTIERLPRKYESLLGNWFPGGTELSVGEWQRIALARAFLRKSQLILLDEPTSAMDPWAESDWLNRLFATAKGRTVVMVTHRLTTARRANVIHVMEQGRIIESGSHEELLALGGRYAASWRDQILESEESPSEGQPARP